MAAKSELQMKRISEIAPNSPALDGIGQIGMGTWALGGPFFAGPGWTMEEGHPLGYGESDDRAASQAIQAAIAHGVTLFDTADAYGTGHAEEVLGAAIKGRRDQVVLATKFGNVLDPRNRQLVGLDASPDYLRAACEASLRRLGTDYIDLYQLHIGDLDISAAQRTAETLQALCDEGKIRSFGWSTDDAERARSWMAYAGCQAVQFDFNLFANNREMVELVTASGRVGLNRTPLAMGFLSGKYTKSSQLPADDIRSRPPASWLPYFKEGGGAAETWEDRLNSIVEILRSDGRTPAQGALAWIWAQSECCVPIPGVRTVAQAEENFSALEYGPLTPEQVREIELQLTRHG